MSGLTDERLADAPRDEPGEMQPLADAPADGEVSPPSLQLPPLAGAWWKGQVHCPYCLELVENTLTGLSTLLGPSLLQCRRCAQPLRSHRWEWSDGSEIAQAWYVAVSFVYVVVCAAIAGVCTAFACRAMHVPVLTPATVAAVAWALAITTLQIVRVIRSIRRVRAVNRQPVKTSFWCLDCFLPQKILAALVLSAAGIAWVLWLILPPE
jgi:hypothetical protein